MRAKTILLILLALALWSGPAAAELTVGLGVGTGTSPYRNYDRKAVPWPMIRYEGERFYIQDLSVGLKLYDQEGLKASVFVAYDPHSFDSGDTSNSRLKRLDDRDEGVLVGGRLSYHHEVGVFSASLAGDVSGHSQGLVGRLAYSHPLDFGQFSLTPHAGVYWHSEKYNDYYYGVSRREAIRSGLPNYEADSAFSPFVGLSAGLRLDEAGRLRVNAFGEVRALPGEVKDSPMVGRSSTYSYGAGVAYTF